MTLPRYIVQLGVLIGEAFADSAQLSTTKNWKMYTEK